MSDAVELSETVEEAVVLLWFEEYLRIWDEAHLYGDGTADAKGS